MTDQEKVRHILHSMDVCSAGIVCAECPLQKKCAERKDLSVAELACGYLMEVRDEGRR